MKRKALLFLLICCFVFSAMPDVIPVNAVNVTANSVKTLVPCGNAIGIKIETEGVLVVGTSKGYGSESPGSYAGLKDGDVIVKANGLAVQDSSDLKEIISGCGGNEIEFEIKRDETLKTVTVKPVKNPLDNTYYIGVWVRDSTAGIGTLTWFDPETGGYGALGHSITDVDTGELMEVSAGEIVDAEIIGAKKGDEGAPGMLIGNFLEYRGTLEKNCSSGITGKIDMPWLMETSNAMEIASKDEVLKGEAYILCCIEGSTPKKYSIEIERVLNGLLWDSKNMIIRITDSRVLEKTGGIVQGMSGSPIIQNGKLVGAITHVFVNDPTRGYGIFIENMLA